MHIPAFFSKEHRYIGVEAWTQVEVLGYYSGGGHLASGSAATHPSVLQVLSYVTVTRADRRCSTILHFYSWHDASTAHCAAALRDYSKR